MSRTPKVHHKKNAEKQEKRKLPRNKWTAIFFLMAEGILEDYNVRAQVQITSEHELFKSPMRIDVVIVKLDDGVVIDNAVMKFFRKNNIIEFKGPKDNLSIEAFDRVMSYFYAYLSNEKQQFDDTTITFVSVKKPEDTLAVLRKERKYKIIDTETPGIYYIKGIGSTSTPMMQLVVISELPKGDVDECVEWLGIIRDDWTVEEGCETVRKFEDVDGDDPKKQAVLSLLNANSNIAEEVKEMIKVHPKIKRVFREWAMETGVAEEWKQVGMQEGAIDVAKRMLARDADVDYVVDVTGLDLNDVLKLKGTM